MPDAYVANVSTIHARPLEFGQDSLAKSLSTESSFGETDIYSIDFINKLYAFIDRDVFGYDKKDFLAFMFFIIYAESALGVEISFPANFAELKILFRDLNHGGKFRDLVNNQFKKRVKIPIFSLDVFINMGLLTVVSGRVFFNKLSIKCIRTFLTRTYKKSDLTKSVENIEEEIFDDAFVETELYDTPFPLKFNEKVEDVTSNGSILSLPYFIHYFNKLGKFDVSEDVIKECVKNLPKYKFSGKDISEVLFRFIMLIADGKYKFPMAVKSFYDTWDESNYHSEVLANKSYSIFLNHKIISKVRQEVVTVNKKKGYVDVIDLTELGKQFMSEVFPFVKVIYNDDSFQLLDHIVLGKSKDFINEVFVDADSVVPDVNDFFLYYSKTSKKLSLDDCDKYVSNLKKIVDKSSNLFKDNLIFYFVDELVKGQLKFPCSVNVFADYWNSHIRDTKDTTKRVEGHLVANILSKLNLVDIEKIDKDEVNNMGVKVNKLDIEDSILVISLKNVENLMNEVFPFLNIKLKEFYLLEAESNNRKHTISLLDKFSKLNDKEVIALFNSIFPDLLEAEVHICQKFFESVFIGSVELPTLNRDVLNIMESDNDIYLLESLGLIELDRNKIEEESGLSFGDVPVTKGKFFERALNKFKKRVNRMYKLKKSYVLDKRFVE